MPSAGPLNGDHMAGGPLTEQSELVGKRVVVNEQIATIRWVGCLPNVAGEWYGLEWDDASRGRHDGSHGGHRFFTTRHPKGGSFVRPAKVSFGISISEAIDLRYGQKDAELYELTDDDLRLRGCETRIELVGIDRVANITQEYARLKSLYLHNQAISSCSPGIGLQFPKVRDINLGLSLLTEWRDVGKICSEFPLLSSLNLSDNRLNLPPPVDSEEGRADDIFLRKTFANITYLVLVRLDYSWTDFLRILRWFPRLQHFTIAYNRVDAIMEVPEASLNALTYLDLGLNPIADFSKLEGLALHAPRLETLLLTECTIEKIEFPDTSDPSVSTSWFPSLLSLGLYGNSIRDWSSIDLLNRLKSLKDLVISDNPVISSMDRETSRQMVIAKIGSLVVLNRNNVDNEERRGAEIDYLKRFGKEWAAAYESPNGEGPTSMSNTQVPSPPAGCQFLRDHPRYMDLVKRYGASEKSEYAERSMALKEGLLRLRVVVDHDGNKRELGEKQYPLRMTVRHLKTALRRLIRAPHSAQLCLSYSTVKTPGCEYELDADTREIGYYTMESGDTLLVRW